MGERRARTNREGHGDQGVTDGNRAGPRIARRAVSLGVEGAFEVLGRARQLEREGRDIVHLEAGEPDWPTPPHIVEAGVRGLRDGLTRYCASPGIPELRAAIAESMGARGVRATPAQVVVTPGSKLMIFHVLLALLESGDEALIPDPGYPAYASVTTFTGARAVPYTLSADGADALDVDEIAAKITPRTRVLILNSPHNPAGRALSVRVIEKLAELARRHDLTVVADEIYGRLTFGEVGEIAPSIAAIPGMAERTVVVDGFSKAYAMTGWRLGYGVMPVRLAEVVSKLVNNSAACTPVFVQMAGIAALEGPQACVTTAVTELRVRRDLIVSGLNALDGVTCAVPEGAFYVLPDVSGVLARLGMSAEALAAGLLDTYGLACLAGSAFGAGAAQHLRFSYATSRDAIASALTRLATAINETRAVATT